MMPTPQAQLLQVPLRVGIDEGTDPSQIPPGTLTQVRNAVWNKLGRLEKRCGSTSLSGALGALQKIWARDGELVATDGASLYSRSSALAAWTTVQDIQALEATWTTAVDTATSVDAADLDATSAYRATAWLSTGILFMQVEDVVSGARVIAPKYVINNVALFRILIKGTTALVIYQLNGSNTISGVVADLTTGTLAAPVAMRGDAALPSQPVTWDLCHNGANLTLVYKNTGNLVQLITYTPTLASGLVVGPELVVNSANVQAVTLHVTTGENIFVAYSDRVAFTVKVAVHVSATLVQLSAPATAYTGTAVSTDLSVIRNDAASCIVAWTELITAGVGSTAKRHTHTMKMSTALAPTLSDLNSHCRTHWTQLAGKLFTVGGRFYMTLSSIRPAIVVANARLSQNTTFVVEVKTVDASSFGGALPHKLTAVIAPRDGAIPTYVCGSPVVGADAFTTALYVSSAVTTTSVARNGMRLVKLSTTLSDPWGSVQLGHVLLTAGGVNGIYDGRRQFELSFLHAPRVISATPAGAGGHMAAGTYLYSFVYEWRDATGLLHRSIPSAPTSVTVVNNDLVNFVFESACTTGKMDLATGYTGLDALPVTVVPYRSKVGGTTLYRLSIEPGYAMFINTAEAATTTGFDSVADASIDSAGTPLDTRPLLYTTGGILDEVMPPSFTTWTAHRGRIWGVAGDRRTIWYTKKFTDDPTIFPGFHENLRVVIDGDIVAIASLDDKLAIFTATSIYVLYGDGPAANGQGSDLEILLVQGEVGCKSARSIVKMPGGILFLAARGYYELSRQLELKWIGREVQDELAAFPNVVFASLVPHKSQVRIGIENDAGSDGEVLVYDFSNGNWSVFTYPARPRSGVVINGVWYFTAGTTAAYESTTSWLDDATWVTLSFEVTLMPMGPLAWQHVRRVQLLGERQTNHDLRLQLAFNNKAAFSQDFTFTAAKVTINNDCPTVRVGSQNGANPKCKAIRVRASDATPTTPGTYPVTTGRGGWFSAIGLEFIPKPGLSRHGAHFSKV